MLARYRVVHLDTGETWEVEAPFADDARRVVGWRIGACQITLVREAPLAEIEYPKIAIQLSPPKAGHGHICPVCNVTLVEKPASEYWWHCPSCDLLYHEWEKQFYRDGEILES